MGVAAAVGVSACGDDDSMTTATAPPATASTVAESPTRTAVPTITPAPATARPTPSASQTAPAEPLARSPGYFLYRSQPGDTLLRLGGYFNGQPGTAKAGFPDQIRDINKLTTSDIPSGTDLFIPLIRTGDDIIPGAGIALAIQRLQPSNASPILFTHGQALRDRFDGFIALHRAASRGVDGDRLPVGLLADGQAANDGERFHRPVSRRDGASVQNRRGQFR